MHAKYMMLLTGLILTSGLASGLLADPPEEKASLEGLGIQSKGHYRWLQPVPSDTGHYIGYYVGGGNGRPHKKQARGEEDGTWGWDYSGWIFRRRVILGWWHGQKFQGGTGAYQTDGLHLFNEEK